MSTSYPYKLEGARGSYNTEINGFEFTAKMILSEVEGDNDIQVGLNALIDINVPLAGTDPTGPPFNADSHLEGCWLRNIDQNIIGKTESGKGIVELTLKYQHSQWGVLQIDAGSQLSQIQTNLDIDGFPIELEYTYPADYGGTNPTQEEEDLRGETKSQGGTVTVNRPERQRIYTVREAVDPTQLAAIYEGTMNAFFWWGGEAGTWLCTSITGTSDNSQPRGDQPQEWVNRYEFQYKIGGWDPTAVYNDVLTGEPVPVELFDAVNPDAMKKVAEYALTDFEDLFPGQ